MQTPCRIFLQGVAKFALHKTARSAPRALVARRMTVHSGSRYVGVRDGSGNRAAGVNADTLQICLQGVAKFALRRGGGA